MILAVNAFTKGLSSEPGAGVRSISAPSDASLSTIFSLPVGTTSGL